MGAGGAALHVKVFDEVKVVVTVVELGRGRREVGFTLVDPPFQAAPHAAEAAAQEAGKRGLGGTEVGGAPPTKRTK